MTRTGQTRADGGQRTGWEHPDTSWRDERPQVIERPTLFDDVMGVPVPTLHRAGEEQRAALETAQHVHDWHSEERENGHHYQRCACGSTAR